MILFFIILLIAAAVVENQSLKNGFEHIEVSRRFSRALLEEGESMELVVTIRNKSRWYIPYIRMEQTLPEHMTSHVPKKDRYEDVHNRMGVRQNIWLRPREAVEKRIPVTVERRGRYLLEDIRLYAGDFLGRKETRKTFTMYTEAVVYPKAGDLPSYHVKEGGLMGEISTNRFLNEDPVLTLGFREYTGREPMKAISWHQSARMGRLMVKNFDHTLRPMVTVVLNNDPDVPDEDREASYALTRRICDDLERQGIQFDFYSNAILAGSFQKNCYVSEGLGRAHQRVIYEELGRATPDTYRTFQRMIKDIARGTAGRSIMLVDPCADAEQERKAVFAFRSAGSKCQVFHPKGGSQ